MTHAKKKTRLAAEDSETGSEHSVGGSPVKLFAPRRNFNRVTVNSLPDAPSPDLTLALTDAGGDLRPGTYVLEQHEDTPWSIRYEESGQSEFVAGVFPAKNLVTCTPGQRDLHLQLFDRLREIGWEVECTERPTSTNCPACLGRGVIEGCRTFLVTGSGFGDADEVVHLEECGRCRGEGVLA